MSDKDDPADAPSSPVEELIAEVQRVVSPDDLEVSNIASKVKSIITDELQLRDLVSQLCDLALDQRACTTVIGAVFGHAGSHAVGDIKLRSLLLQRVQKMYEDREELNSQDRSCFVTSSMFLGDIFYYVKTDAGTPLKVLAGPVVTYLSMVMKPHLSEDPAPDIDEEMTVVAKQLLQNGDTLYRLVPDKIVDILRDITEVIIRHPLGKSCKLNILAALAESWPKVNEDSNPRTVHASLAAKLGFSLNI
ncbi:UNVERIFIED_CONTAM: hypothetical protein RMT77_016083 [Armadillidium vulgare]